ncbi:MAG: flagellar biosynthesis anti-sigma factor FlgM [Cellvibrionaceae bacterium]
MIIDPNNRLPTGGALNSRTKPAAGVEGVSDRQSQNKDSGNASSAEKDSVNLSPEAQALKRLEAQIQNSPDIDSEKVAAIKKAIADGNFQINVERIVERMLEQDAFLS